MSSWARVRVPRPRPQLCGALPLLWVPVQTQDWWVCLPSLCVWAVCLWSRLCLWLLFASTCVLMCPWCPCLSVPMSCEGRSAGSGVWADSSHGWVCLCSGPKFLTFCGVVIMIHIKTCILPFSFCIAVCSGKIHCNIPSLSVHSSGFLSVFPEFTAITTNSFQNTPIIPQEKPAPGSDCYTFVSTDASAWDDPQKSHHIISGPFVSGFSLTVMLLGLLVLHTDRFISVFHIASHTLQLLFCTIPKTTQCPLLWRFFTADP